MILIALTGGIGSGKSTVAGALADRGAIVLDADAIVRDLQQPGRPVFAAMVDRWGPGVVQPSGELDRAAVAEIVFSDSAELEALEAMTHPAVRSEMLARLQELASTDHIVVQDIPLLEKVMGERRSAASVVVVDCPIETAIQRLVDHRGFDRADVEARLAAQISREERRAMADYVIDNSGGLDELSAEVDRCWEWIVNLPPTSMNDEAE